MRDELLSGIVRSAIVLLVTFVTRLSVARARASGPPFAASRELEVFRDDFNLDGPPDPSRWHVLNQAPETNGEEGLYVPDNVRVEGGHLHICSEKRRLGRFMYTTGALDTHGRFAFQYGSVEFRARLAPGRGLWSTVQLLTTNCSVAVDCGAGWPPEITILDVKGGWPSTSADNFYAASVYRELLDEKPSSWGAHTNTPLATDPTRDFHVYRLVWTKSHLTLHVNEQRLLHVSERSRIPQVPLQMSIHVGVGGIFSGYPDVTTVFPAEFLMDYVVVRRLGPEEEDDEDDDESASAVAVAEPLASRTVLPSLIGSLGGVSGVVVLAVGAVWLMRRRQSGLAPWSTGSSAKVMNRVVKWTTCNYGAGTGGSGLYHDVLSKYISLISIPAANVRLNSTVLGKGEFGLVYAGSAWGIAGGPRKWSPVAVKTVLLKNGEASVETQRQLAEEIRVMTKVGRHLNVVNLLGIVINDSPLLVLELCRNGSLLSYVRAHAGAFFYDHTAEDGSYLSFNTTHEQCLQAAASTLSVARPASAADGATFDGLIMSTRDLVGFAYQISRGMGHLAARRIIHRDLSARNVLVADGKIVKIADFGMARQRQTAVYVLTNSQARLPVKWMPPEAIYTRTFSHSSDVWSYGVLLWEMFSLGCVPYSDVQHLVGADWTVGQFAAWLDAGHHMVRPAAAPLSIYRLQQHCWRRQPAERPTFCELETELSQITGADQAPIYLALDQPYNSFNQLNRTLLDQLTAADAAPPTGNDIMIIHSDAVVQGDGQEPV